MSLNTDATPWQPEQQYPPHQQPAQPEYAPYGYAPQPWYPPPGYVLQPIDRPSFGFAVLGFFIPIVGLILWLVWRDQTPLKAKSAGTGALVRMGVYAVLIVIVIIGLTSRQGF